MSIPNNKTQRNRIHPPDMLIYNTKAIYLLRKWVSEKSLVENWDYREVGHITIGSFRPGPDGGYAINDGNHRCVALALLLLTHSITYQPVTAIMAITQTHTRPRGTTTRIRRLANLFAVSIATIYESYRKNVV